MAVPMTFPRPTAAGFLTACFLELTSTTPEILPVSVAPRGRRGSSTVRGPGNIPDKLGGATKNFAPRVARVFRGGGREAERTRNGRRNRTRPGPVLRSAKDMSEEPRQNENPRPPKPGDSKVPTRGWLFLIAILGVSAAFMLRRRRTRGSNSCARRTSPSFRRPRSSRRRSPSIPSHPCRIWPIFRGGAAGGHGGGRGGR